MYLEMCMPKCQQPTIYILQQPEGSTYRIWSFTPTAEILAVQDAVQKPFEAGQEAGRVRLMALLKHIMIRAAKSDLVTIPPCHHKVGSYTARIEWCQ